MTETAGKTPAPELGAWLEAWKTCTQNVLAQASSLAVAFEFSSEPLPSAGSDLYFTVVAGGAVRGEMSLRIPSSSALWLNQKFLGATEPPTEITAEHKESVEELLRQIAGLTATAVAPTASGEVQFHVSASAAPSWPPAATILLRTRDEAGDPVSIEIQISAALSSTLQALAAKPKEEHDSVPAPPPPFPPPASYGRLLDVGLDVKLRFGTRRMQLRDVLALSPGIVVELDSKVHSPADLLLDGRVVARGEVVVVDGRYGLRVTEIPDSPPPA